MNDIEYIKKEFISLMEERKKLSDSLNDNFSELGRKAVIERLVYLNSRILSLEWVLKDKGVK